MSEQELKGLADLYEELSTAQGGMLLDMKFLRGADGGYIATEDVCKVVSAAVRHVKEHGGMTQEEFDQTWTAPKVNVYAELEGLCHLDRSIKTI